MGGTPLNAAGSRHGRIPRRARLLAGRRRRGVFAFGDAPFEGSDGGTTNSAHAVGIAGRPGGYWIAYGIDPGAR